MGWVRARLNREGSPIRQNTFLIAISKTNMTGREAPWGKVKRLGGKGKRVKGVHIEKTRQLPRKNSKNEKTKRKERVGGMIEGAEVGLVKR